MFLVEVNQVIEVLVSSCPGKQLLFSVNCSIYAQLCSYNELPSKHMADLPLAIFGLSRTQYSPVRPQSCKVSKHRENFEINSNQQIHFILYHQMFYHTSTNQFSLVGGPTLYNPVVTFYQCSDEETILCIIIILTYILSVRKS